MYTDLITKPTLILNPQIARRNLQTMAGKTRYSEAIFRPHFKTHQSAQIGEWFRAEGVQAITVSSVDMAAYFAAAGWQDILIAFTANRRELQAINHLARQVHLGLLFEDTDTLEFFMQKVEAPLDIWLEADNGSRRTGIPIQQVETFIHLAHSVRAPHTLRGVLTHAGNTYHADSTASIRQIYQQTLADLLHLKQSLVDAGWPKVSISYGDTPSLSLADRFAGLDEVRPGNFIFYDATQLTLGSCYVEDIAVGVACPVIATYPKRGELVLYGGAVHLSKDRFDFNDNPAYGYVCLPTPDGWGPLIPGAYVSGLWQEHALVSMDMNWLRLIHPGDLVIVLPSHSCLTVDLFDRYLTPQGEWIKIKQ